MFHVHWISKCCSTWNLWVQGIKKIWDGSRCTSDLPKREPRTTLTLFEETLLTLVRIRRGYDIRHISYLFGITQSPASKIFSPWCKFLAIMFKPLLLWPSKELVWGNLPDSFKNYPRTRIIIDATEFKIEKPFHPVAQKQTWSNYKHANTVKLLVGKMPSGAITLISKVYSGCISDMRITEKVDYWNC